MKNIATSITGKHKQTLVIAGTVAIVGSFILSYIWLNPDLRTKVYKVSSTGNTNQTARDAVDKLGKSLDQVNLDTVLYDIISFKNLPVYPIGWVQRFFTPSEQANQLISGPDADADNDGLTNKEEYFYASSPVNKDTFCNGKIDDKNCKGNSDKQNVDAGISPLTGLSLDSYDKVKIKKQDYAILNRIQDSFENAAKEGVDFPTLYQLSKTIDLSDQYSTIKVLTQSNERVNIINYISFRSKLLQEVIDQGSVAIFSELYGSTKVDEIKNTKNKYVSKVDELKNTYIPERFIDLHRAYIFFFERVIELLDIRIDGVSQKKIESEDFRKISKIKGVEVMWGYRTLLEISSNLKVDIN